MAASCDVVVVGGGIVGLAVARELLARHPERTVRVLEREGAVGAHQTGHNSGVLHAGLYYAPGSLKARLCVHGARRLGDYCEERGLPIRRNGKLVVAVDPGELPRLDELERRARANGVPGLRRLGPGELREVEPHVAGIAALHSPATASVDFRAVAGAFAEDVRAAGGEVLVGAGARAIEETARGLVVHHGEERTGASFAVVAAGASADRIATAAGATEDPRIIPFRGSWMRLAGHRRELVRAHVYPVPDPSLPFLGVHFSRDVHDEVLVGPTALLVAARDAYDLRRISRADLRSTLTWPGTYRLAARWWRTGLRELWLAAAPRALAAAARRYVPELAAEDLVPGPAGVRAQALGRDGALVDDFVMSETPRALHVRNAPSPAATASLALAELIVSRVASRLDSHG